MSHPPLVDVPERWPVESSEHLHRDPWVVSLRADRVRAPRSDADAHRRLVLEHPGGVVVLALDDDDRAFCLWQYRHPAEHRLVELPAGLLDGDEPEEPIDVARRELREEAQLAGEHWTPLLSAWSSPGVSAERLHYFVARGLTHVDRGDFELRHEEADMQTGWVPFDDLHDAAASGRLTDAPTVLCVLAARARGLV